MSQLWGGFLLQPMRFLEDLPTRPLTGWLGLDRASERASDGASERGGAMRNLNEVSVQKISCRPCYEFPPRGLVRYLWAGSVKFEDCPSKFAIQRGQ